MDGLTVYIATPGIFEPSDIVFAVHEVLEAVREQYGVYVFMEFINSGLLGCLGSCRTYVDVAGTIMYPEDYDSIEEFKKALLDAIIQGIAVGGVGEPRHTIPASPWIEPEGMYGAIAG